MKKVRLLYVGSIALLAVSVFISTVFAQETAPQPQNQQQSAVNTQNSQEPASMEEFMAGFGSKNAEFGKALAPYRTVLGQLQETVVEFQTATPERKDALQKQYDELIKKAETTRKNLIDSATAAFLEAPFENPIVLNFVFQMLSYENASDNYEVSFKLADTIMKQSDQLNTQAGPLFMACADAAFGVMEFDKAEEWYKKARELKAPLTEESMGNISMLPKLRELWKAEQTIRAKEATDDNLPRVLIRTTKGDITLELFENEAPNTVANFISLVNKGFYKDVPFHRVLPHFMAQGGDPTGTGTSGPGYNIDCECYPASGKPTPRNHFRGSISMANAGRNTNGSQFFLMFVPLTHLNGKHTVFGRVIDGMGVLADLQRVDPSDENAVIDDRDMIIEAKVLRSRNHTYEPVKNNNRR